MRTRLTRIVSAFIAMLFATFGISSAASASGTADYQYTCTTSGMTQNAWAMPAGTPLSDCVNGVIEVRQHGQMIDVIHVNGDGAPFEPNPQAMQCVIALIGTGVFLVTLRNTGAVARVMGSIPGVAGLSACTA